MSQNPSKRQLIRRGASVVVAAIALFICGFYIPYWRPIYWWNRAALQKEIEAAKLRGTPIRFSDLAVEDPIGFQVGDRVKSALELLVELPAEIRHKLFSEELLTDSDKATIREILAQNQPLFDQIEKAKPLGECRFRYNFQTPVPMSLPFHEVRKIYSLGELYLAECQLTMEGKEYDQSLASIFHLFELMESLSQEQLLLPLGVRVQLGSKSLIALQKFLEKTDLTDEQFEKLDAMLLKIESQLSMRASVLAEGASAFTNLENIGHPDIQKLFRFAFSIRDRVSPHGEEPAERDFRHWSRLDYSPYVMGQQAWTLRTVECLARIVDEPGPTATLEWKNLQAEIKHKVDSDHESPLSRLVPQTSFFRDSVFLLRHKLKLGRITIRLRQYAKEHGRFPTSLAEITDHALPKLPLNLWDDHPLAYKLTPTGCVVSLQTDPDHASLIFALALPLNTQ